MRSNPISLGPIRVLQYYASLGACNSPWEYCVWLSFYYYIVVVFIKPRCRAKYRALEVRRLRNDRRHPYKANTRLAGCGILATHDVRSHTRGLKMLVTNNKIGDYSKRLTHTLSVIFGSGGHILSMTCQKVGVTRNQNMILPYVGVGASSNTKTKRIEEILWSNEGPILHRECGGLFRANNSSGCSGQR